MDISQRIAEELGVKKTQTDAAIALLDEGATVPFIARYRKEATAGLDDTQLRQLEERLVYLRELEERRAAILKSIDEQEKLTPELKAAILEADTKTRLEDLYAPYKPKRRTRAQIAREAGIEPLLDALLSNPRLDPAAAAEGYINAKAGFEDCAAVLEGARQIFMERAGDDADLVGKLRDYAWEHALLTSSVVSGEEQKGAKFADYFEYAEAIKAVPSHRALALFRGRDEGVLRIRMQIAGQDDLENNVQMGLCDNMVAKHFSIAQQKRAADNWLLESARLAWRVKIALRIEAELLLRLRESAEAEAIRVFGENLRDLLLAAPAGMRVCMGLDPGLRTGVKVVVLDQTGKLLEYITIFPHAPKNQWDQSLAVLAVLCGKHKVDLISIGNGTASRETDKLVNDLMKRHPELRLTSLVVSEAGASVYSASELAAKEFPDLDVSYRGAVSIARRLQDPLAELVKIEPKSIGVGQYQHDVNQTQLARKLDAVVEDCVNAVGVEVNTASAPLLARVAGLTETLAVNIVAFREKHGVIENRQQLLKVPRLGPKAFEQAAGFLRIRNGANPLDASAVHPEAYPVVEKILKASKRKITDVIGDSKFLKGLAANDFADAQFGATTVRDILQELEKPGRDPRPEFRTASFKEGVETVADLKEGMILEGVITNVTNFGAFVDIGVHQDGLVHISALSETYVKDPRDVVKTGQVVKVKVMEVDLQRQRVALSMRLTDAVEGGGKNTGKHDKAGSKPARQTQQQPKTKNKTAPPVNSAMAQAFAKLKK
ncbi:MAG: RNA-binding transcriptional accessory protein [Gammaproteobacteria bacterium]|nr:RNA-binding transcriptional accessory protein [Gammaproteobacteria bacterium]